MNAASASAQNIEIARDPDGTTAVLVEGRRVAIHQVHYDEGSRARLDPLFTPYRNTQPTPFLESSVIVDLIARGAHARADYFGVVSWRVRDKIPLPSREWFERMRADGFRSDAYSFFGRLGSGRVWLRAERKHPGILRAAAVLFSRLGLDLDPRDVTAPLVYQNHVICRSAVYEHYQRSLLTPALDAMSDASDGMLRALLGTDARYGTDRVPPAQLHAVFGHGHYTLHPFVAERLFSTWLALHPEVRLRHIWRGRFVERDAVAAEPELAMQEGE